MRRFSQGERVVILQRYLDGESQASIASDLRCNVTTIRSITRGHSRHRCRSCRKPLTGMRRAHCSVVCRNLDTRKHKHCHTCSSPLTQDEVKRVKYCGECRVGTTGRTLADVRRQRKERLVAMKGGVCQLCGYSRCLAALEFHHRDPSAKLFCISSGSLSNRTWRSLVAELAKCDLLCSNCHVEVEVGFTQPVSSIS